MTAYRDQALAPLTHGDAERILPALSVGRQTLDRRVLRARCLRHLESFDVAWAELTALLPQTSGVLAARVATDLVHLAYYLARPRDGARYARGAESDAAHDPLLLAELRLAVSINRAAANEITAALHEARWAEDAVAAAPRGRGSDVVSLRIQRNLAHLLSHQGDHIGARVALDAAARHAARVNDPWETAWCTYANGFVAWMSGRNDEAVAQFARAEAALSRSRAPLWRYTLLCLARSRMELGDRAEGDRLARESGIGAPEDLAHLALLRGETEVAGRILERAGHGLPSDEHFRDLLRAIVRGRRGDPRGAVRELDELAKDLGSRGMGHWAAAASVHAAYWRDQLVRGGGTARAVALVRDLAARGGAGFAYYLPEVAVWLGHAAERDSVARPLAREILAGAERAQSRSGPGPAPAPSQLDEATIHLRAAGLTWRELAILRELERVRAEDARLDRAALAQRLRMSPNTLRDHLTRIRAKLEVDGHRGDEVLLEAARARQTVIV